MAVPLTWTLTLFHIDHYYTAYWQAVRACTKQLDVPPRHPERYVALCDELSV